MSYTSLQPPWRLPGKAPARVDPTCASAGNASTQPNSSATSACPMHKPSVCRITQGMAAPSKGTAAHATTKQLPRRQQQPEAPATPPVLLCAALRGNYMDEVEEEEVVEMQGSAEGMVEEAVDHAVEAHLRWHQAYQQLSCLVEGLSEQLALESQEGVALKAQVVIAKQRLADAERRAAEAEARVHKAERRAPADAAAAAGEEEGQQVEGPERIGELRAQLAVFRARSEQAERRACEAEAAVAALTEQQRSLQEQLKRLQGQLALSRRLQTPPSQPLKPSSGHKQQHKLANDSSPAAFLASHASSDRGTPSSPGSCASFATATYPPPGGASPHSASPASGRSACNEESRSSVAGSSPRGPSEPAAALENAPSAAASIENALSTAAPSPASSAASPLPELLPSNTCSPPPCKQQLSFSSQAPSSDRLSPVSVMRGLSFKAAVSALERPFGLQHKQQVGVMLWFQGWDGCMHRWMPHTPSEPTHPPVALSAPFSELQERGLRQRGARWQGFQEDQKEEAIQHG